MNKKNELAACGALLHDKGLVIFSGGNISVRDGNALIIKKQGVDMSLRDPSGFIRIPFNNVHNKLAILSTETPFHIACYEAREDAGAVIHTHSPFTVATAEISTVLSGISYEFEYIMKSPVPVIEYLKPGSIELAHAIKDKVADGANAVLMKKHGAVVVGKDLCEAFSRTMALERACHVLMLTAGVTNIKKEFN